MTTRNTHEWTVAEVRDAAITNEHPIPLRVRDMLNAYADDLERRAEGVTDEVLHRACKAYIDAQPEWCSDFVECMRVALGVVWPVAAEPATPAGVSDEAADAVAKVIADHIGHGMREKCLKVARVAIESADKARGL